MTLIKQQAIPQNRISYRYDHLPSGQDRFILAALGGYGGGTENIYNRFIGLTNSFTEIAGSGVNRYNGVGVQGFGR